MAQPIWNENSKHYSLDEKTDPKDRITVEVGDSQDVTTFHPQMKLSRWDNEANVSFRLVHDWLPGTKITNDEANGVITWTKKVGQNNWIARFYEDWGTPEGAYKFVELVLPAKPPTNQISFTTQSKDVDFFYQPPLTPEEIAEGAERPPEVVGSYAIYSKSSGGMNRADGKEYKVGKVGHLYRAKLIDANGSESWGNYNTDLNTTGILTITADQTWLDNAVYPVVLDPTFGYVSTGGTELTTSPDIGDSMGAKGPDEGSFTAPENGEVTSLTFIPAINATVRGILYLNDDATYPYSNTLVTYGPQTSITADVFTNTLSLASASITSGQEYTLGIWSNTNNTGYYYDSAESLYWVFRESVGTYHATNPPPDPINWGAQSTNRIASIYATYTASAAGTNMQLNIGDTWKTITSAQINIGDTWKAITKIQINIGDTWKSVFALLLSIIPFWRK